MDVNEARTRLDIARATRDIESVLKDRENGARTPWANPDSMVFLRPPICSGAIRHFRDKGWTVAADGSYLSWQ